MLFLIVAFLVISGIYSLLHISPHVGCTLLFLAIVGIVLFVATVLVLPTSIPQQVY